MFYCQTCDTTERERCTCDRIDGLNDGDLAEAGPIRYRERVMERNVVNIETLPPAGQARDEFLRLWALGNVLGKSFSISIKDESTHLKDAVRACEAADVLVAYVQSGSAEATKTMLALAEQSAIPTSA